MTRLRWGELLGCSLAYEVASLYKQHESPLLLIADDTETANRLYHQLQFFIGGNSDLFLFPNYETLAYDQFSPDENILAKRLSILSRLSSKSCRICIVSVATLLQRLPPRTFLETNSRVISVGDQFNIEDFRSRLFSLGYTSVSQVQAYGEYAIRGSIVDFYSPNSDYPTRIDLWDDCIDSLRYFNPDNQQSIDKINSASVLPAREFLIDKKTIESFRYKFRSNFTLQPDQCFVYSSISESIIPAGIEYYLPLFHDETATLFDYLCDDTICIYPNTLSEIATKHTDYIEERYQLLAYTKERALLKPALLYLDNDELLKCLGNFGNIETQTFKYRTTQEQNDIRNFKTRIPPPVALDQLQKNPTQKLEKFIQNYNGRILVTAPSQGYLEQLLEILTPHRICPKLVENWQAFLQSSEKFCICCADLYQSVMLDDIHITLLAYHDIVAKVPSIGQQSKQARNVAALIQSIGDLEIGSATVHQDHGVGRFTGIKTMDIGGYLSEFCVLEYADSDKLYVPVTALHLLSRYTGNPSAHIKLDKLGGRQWNVARRKATIKAYDVAAELLDIHARRNISANIRFEIDHPNYHVFACDFPYTETADQESAIDDVLQDMNSDKSMDRIVCGDVGFGKTEVAMRAAFIAVHNHKQVAVLVPTTLLAIQHLEAFRERFAKWPVRIEMLSRFVSNSRKKEILAAIQSGNVDIVIATHTLLRTPPNFAHLGLIVIDEEHCFGVQDKEKIKSLRSSADVLTLTATPIPRTLSMSLGGLKSLSVIATPPPGRQAIKTFVTQWDDELIYEACNRELRRGGQVFFIHNEVRTIDDVAENLRVLLPDVQIGVAHGQMSEKNLEQTMMNFYNHNYNVLVCTTIIESGIDIPNANTMLINRADRLGLAQLHQLRGRVGRSHHTAYAYLLIPTRTEITEDAEKRLQVIESLEDLSIGFTIASHDLEIRGAGELLGEEQSGHIHKVGFAMYNDLLKRAVETLKSGLLPNVDQPLDTVAEINLGEPALIPPDYIPDVNLRLVFYRRIASAIDKESLAALKVEMIDRFGALPDYAKNLYTNASVRIICHNIGIRKLIANESELHIYFEEQPKLNLEKLIAMVKNEPEKYRFVGHKKLIIAEDENSMETVTARQSKIQGFFELLSLEQAA
ncbi:MAG: transcription-repair coupling factor [Gammaproteobacteria bacterium]|nr:transcription-repair coupling factor [Gammaproteobacteria bacterium]